VKPSFEISASNARRVAVVVVALGFFACTPTPASVYQLRSRAAFDLSCPPQYLQVYHLHGRIKGVFGCGRRLTYVQSCDSPFSGGSCLWLLDTPGVEPPGCRSAFKPPMPAIACPACVCRCTASQAKQRPERPNSNWLPPAPTTSSSAAPIPAVKPRSAWEIDMNWR